MAEIPAAVLETAPLTAEEQRRLLGDRRLSDYPHHEFIDQATCDWLRFHGWLAARGDYDDDIGTDNERITGDGGCA